MTKARLRDAVRSNLGDIQDRLNEHLRGESLAQSEPILARVGRGGVLPHWYEQLKRSRTLPNLDGKTIGSVVEMLLVAVLETETLAGFGVPPLAVNPARGVDLPDLDLGVKAPSTNYCTSEPFFSAYERLYGSDHDALVLLTDYQQSKRHPPLRLQILNCAYLDASEIADAGLCMLAKAHRDWLLTENESWAKRLFRFLAFVNQSDFRATRLAKMIKVMREPVSVDALIEKSERDFEALNASRDIPIHESELDALQGIGLVNPRHVGVLDALDNWVVDCWKEAGRAPNEAEWTRLRESPLNGRLSLSFALQWRYNFGAVFR